MGFPDNICCNATPEEIINVPVPIFKNVTLYTCSWRGVNYRSVNPCSTDYAPSGYQPGRYTMNFAPPGQVAWSYEGIGAAGCIFHNLVPGGNYTITYYDQFGCLLGTTTITVIEDCSKFGETDGNGNGNGIGNGLPNPAGIDGSLESANLSNATFTIFPNPTSTNFRILPMNLNGEELVTFDKVSILSSSGTVVREIENVNQNYTFDTNGLSSGAYHVRIKHKGETTTLKLVVL